MTGHEGLPRPTVEIVASVAQHRALSLAQVREIHLPGRGDRWCQRVLRRITDAGLLGHAVGSGAPRHLWFATEAGVRVVREAGALAAPPRLLGPEDATGPLKAHTLAVNDAAISFLGAARERGEEFGPLAWRHEVAYPLRPAGRGRRSRALIADALLTYVRLTPAEVILEQRFLELDRATLPVDALAAELSRYADLFRAEGTGGEPIWRRRHPAFPAVLCVLAGSRRALLERRRDTVLMLLATDPQLARTPEVRIGVCLLEDLVSGGPFAPIFAERGDPDARVDWLGEAP
jgi:hypothetical protein